MTTVLRRSRILDAGGRRMLVPATRHVRARWDAAQTSVDNVRHWTMADSLSADAASSPAIRKVIRERGRYEVANSGWARSMVSTLAHEVIGTGPRLQILTGSAEADNWLERQFAAWCFKINLGRKFRTMRIAKAVDGEGLALHVNNRRLGDVQLDLRLFETEHLATPGMFLGPNQVDGIDLDENGNPDRYHILKHHPGGSEWGVNPDEEITPPPVPEEVIHIFRHDRPGQHRGVSELASALPLFSRLRRYTLAVLQSAENVAEWTMFLKTRQPEAGEFQVPRSGDTANEPSSYETMDAIDIERGMMTVLPEDTEPFQLKPEQPSTTHGDFIRVTLAEAFAALCLPYSVGAFDSSQENFASGKLTRQGFKRAVQIERVVDWDPVVVATFWAWFSEAKATIPTELRAAMGDPSSWDIAVRWDGVEDIDPEKAARARKAELESGQTGIPRIYTEKGLDFEPEQEMNAKALGLTVEKYREMLREKLLGPSAPAPGQATNNGASEEDNVAVSQA